MDYSGDDFYDDDVTSGIEEVLTYEYLDDGANDDDPSPYDGTYAEE